MNVYVGELYKEVEYIQSSGTQYIDTGYIPSNNTKIEMSMGGFDSSTSGNSLFGARYSWNTDASIGRGFGWSVNASTSPYGYGGMFGRRYSSGNDNFNVFNWGDGGNHILSLDQSGFYQDGVKKYTPNTVTFTSPVNLYIFALNDNGTLAERTNYKLYYFKVWNSGTLVRDFVPCYRKSDSVIGLYDLVNNQFYTNSGTGTFSKGNDVSDGLHMMELKNAYIGEVYEYSYDFRSKSNSQLQADGWTLSDSSYTAYNSNGVYYTKDGIGQASRSLPSLANAKKITFNEVIVVASTSYASGASFRSYTNATNQKRFGIVVNKDQGYNMKCGYAVSNTNYFKQDITTTGTKTNSLVYDLVNKTITYTLDGTTYTGTLTDSNITDLKSNNGVYIYVGQVNTTTTQIYIQSIGILVE